MVQENMLTGDDFHQSLEPETIKKKKKNWEEKCN